MGSKKLRSVLMLGRAFALLCRRRL